MSKKGHKRCHSISLELKLQPNNLDSEFSAIEPAALHTWGHF